MVEEEDDAEDGDAGDNGAVTLSPKSFRKLIRVISPNQSLFTASPVSSRNFTPPATQHFKSEFIMLL